MLGVLATFFGGTVVNTGAACTRPDTAKPSCRNTILQYFSMRGQLFNMMNSSCVGLSKPFKCKRTLIALAVRTKVVRMILHCWFL